MRVVQQLGQIVANIAGAAKRGGNTVASITGGSYGAGSYFGQQSQTIGGGVDWNEATGLQLVEENEGAAVGAFLGLLRVDRLVFRSHRGWQYRDFPL